MNEPHKIIEKEILWDEFCNILSGDEQLIQIRQKYNENYTSSRNYDIKDRRMFRDKNKVEFYNGTDVDYKFEKEFNETVKYGLGSFYPVVRIFDTEDTGEEEEYEGNDGCYYTRSIKRKLETYKLHEREVRIYGVRHF
jgi:hypothetical protein